MAETFTVADGDLFTLLRWTKFTGIDLSKRPVLMAYVERIEARPAVKDALKAESANE